MLNHYLNSIQHTTALYMFNTIKDKHLVIFEKKHWSIFEYNKMKEGKRKSNPISWGKKIML